MSGATKPRWPGEEMAMPKADEITKVFSAHFEGDGPHPSVVLTIQRAGNPETWLLPMSSSAAVEATEKLTALLRPRRPL